MLHSRVPLTVPEISLDQWIGVYLRGATIKITCTVKRQYNSTIYFYRNNQLLNSRQLFTKDTIGTFTVINANQGGQYQCKYKTVVNRRRLRSQLSEPVTVTIADLPKPHISVDSILASMGGKITFNCTSPRYLPGLTFYLYKLGDSNYLEAQAAAAWFNSATFTIMKISHSNGGNYTCLYKIDGKRRRLTSGLGDPVHFTVKDKPTGLEAGVGSTLTLVLIIGLLGVCFWKREFTPSILFQRSPHQFWKESK
ncbi:immunoglobulin superfamily member 1-like [Cetorhinus maximus]